MTQDIHIPTVLPVWTHLTSMKEAFSLAEKAQLTKPDAVAITCGWSSACLGKKCRGRCLYAELKKKNKVLE